MKAIWKISKIILSFFLALAIIALIWYGAELATCQNGEEAVPFIDFILYLLGFGDIDSKDHYMQTLFSTLGLFTVTLLSSVFTVSLFELRSKVKISKKIRIESKNRATLELKAAGKDIYNLSATLISKCGEELTTEAGEEELFKFTFKMLDTKSKFSLTVDELIASGEKAEDIDGEIILSFYKKPDRTRAPKFTDLVDMKVRDFDRLVDDLLDYLEDLGEDYEAIFDIDISGVIPDIEIPGMHPQPDYEDEDDVIGGGNNDDVIGGGNNDEYIGGIVDGDYFYSDPDGFYNENYRFSGDRYYYNAYDVENDEYLVQESGTYRMIGENIIVFCPDGAGEFGEYEVYVSIYPDRLVMFDMQYKKVS